MRTSVKILIAALVVLVVSMGIYNQQLKTAFKNGAYKLPFNNYIASNLSGFHNINLKSASTINIKIEKGPYRILIDPNVNEYAQVKLNGDTLEIESVFPDDYRGFNSDFAMYVSCPNLSSIHSNGIYHVRSREFVDRVAAEYFKFRRTTIEGFKQDSLNIVALNASNIWLVKDTIKNLNALIGTDSASATNFYIGAKNHFDRTNIDVRNYSRFWIGNADSTQTFHYTLTDSARLMVSGQANHIIKNLQ